MSVRIHGMQTNCGRLIASFSLLLWLSIGSVASAQVPTAEQLQRLQQLTPEQQEALLEALGESTETSDEEELPDTVLIEPRSDELEDEQTESDESVEEIMDQLRNAIQAEQLQDEETEEPELLPFGYDLFAGEPTTFAPATDIPVPVDYVVGPGDSIELQLFGNENNNYKLTIGRDGMLNLPRIGPIPVSGLEFSELQRMLEQRIADQMIGVRVSVSMGALRSIRVFVLGEAYRPGSYTVSSLSTMTNALFVSGGVNDIGSLRRIQLKRQGKLVSEMDLYDLLLNGDTSKDARLQPGDVIFLPPVGATVGVAGEVRRPAIYELNSESQVAEVLRLAGGLLPTAYPAGSKIERINSNRERIMLNVDLSTPAGLQSNVMPHDTLRIFPVLERPESVVSLSGHVFREGIYQWRPGMRLVDLIPDLRVLQPQSDLNYLLIRREDPATQIISAVSANLAKAIADPSSSANIALRPWDQVTVFDREADRTLVVEPLLEELGRQSAYNVPVATVGIGGRVRFPGRYPLQEGMRVSDLLLAGGLPDEAAYIEQAELTRYSVASGQQRKTELLIVDLQRILAGDREADLLLMPYDVVNIKEIPLWSELEVFEIEGEVRFPGPYPIRRGETLGSVLDRAGGLTDLSFPEGAIFLRTELREQELEQLAELAERLQVEIESAAAADTTQQSSLDARLALLEQVRSTEATGRLVIDLHAIMAAAPGSDVVLRGGDRLLIPRESQTVTIIGEIQFPTSHIFQTGVNRNDYINLSGGLTPVADKKRIYVVRANGSVIATRRSLFFTNRNNSDIRPGDTIVVPIKPDPISRLSFWTSVTTIIYNIGIAAAAVSSF